jgi:hypothetical protein
MTRLRTDLVLTCDDPVFCDYTTADHDDVLMCLLMLNDGCAAAAAANIFCINLGYSAIA